VGGYCEIEPDYCAAPEKTEIDIDGQMGERESARE